VKLRRGTKIEKARDAIESMLPPDDQRDVEVRTRDALNRKEEEFWMTGTAVGQFFYAGVFISLLVGGVFVYQMMAADIAKRLPEYATIRALGYPPDYLSRVVYWQGFLLAVMGYVPGIAASLLGYLITHQLANVPIEMTAERALGVLGLTVVMCMVSALIAVRAVQTANPADLF
jgi:putative ABC transport system permease protein